MPPLTRISSTSLSVSPKLPSDRVRYSLFVITPSGLVSSYPTPWRSSASAASGEPSSMQGRRWPGASQGRRRILPDRCRGELCIRPPDVPTGTGARHIHSAPRGPSNGAYSIRPYTDAAKPAGNWTKNRFGAQNPPRIAPKTVLKPGTRRGLHQKLIWSPKPVEFHAKNRFEAQNPPRIAPKTVSEPKTRRGLRQKSI